MTSKKNKNYTNKRGWVQKKSPAFVTTPPRPSGSVGGSLGGLTRAINREKKKFFSEHVKGKIEHLLPMAHKVHSKFLASALESKFDQVTIGLLDHTTDGVVNRGGSKYGFVEKESIPTQTNATQYLNEKVNTSFVTGKLSTQSVTKMEELFGSSNYVLFDSETDLPDGREGLTTNFGFNQKRFLVLGSNLIPNVKDYIDLFDLTESVFSRSEDQVPYGLAKQERINFKFSNLNRFLDLNVNVHLVELRDREITGTSLFNYTFYSNIEQPDYQTGKIPEKYQLQSLESSEHKDFVFNKSVLCSKRARLDMSAAFKQNAKVVKTFKRRLKAGMIWNLDVRVNLGPGICLDQLFYDNYVLKKKNDSQPSTYVYVLECVGTDTTLVQASNGIKQEHIGTAAGSLCWEVNKSIQVVNSDISLGNAGFENSKAAIKVYRKDISDKKYFNVDFDKIEEREVRDGFYIPVRTEINIKEGGPV